MSRGRVKEDGARFSPFLCFLLSSSFSFFFSFFFLFLNHSSSLPVLSLPPPLLSFFLPYFLLSFFFFIILPKKVYKGRCYGMDVVVKVPIDISDNKLDDFMNEVKLLSKIHHPNICLFLGASLQVYIYIYIKSIHQLSKYSFLS